MVAIVVKTMSDMDFSSIPTVIVAIIREPCLQICSDRCDGQYTSTYYVVVWSGSCRSFLFYSVAIVAIIWKVVSGCWDIAIDKDKRSLGQGLCDRHHHVLGLNAMHYGIFITTTSISADICFSVTIFPMSQHSKGRFHNGFRKLKVTKTTFSPFFILSRSNLQNLVCWNSVFRRQFWEGLKVSSK